MSGAEIDIILDQLKEIRTDCKEIGKLSGEVHEYMKATRERCAGHEVKFAEIYNRVRLLEQAKSAVKASAWVVWLAVCAASASLAWLITTLINFFKISRA